VRVCVYVRVCVAVSSDASVGGGIRLYNEMQHCSYF
jgi:hypothetical protein